MAQQFAQIKDSSTSYGGFLLPEAAMTLATATQMDAESAQESAKQIEAVRKTMLSELAKNNHLPEEARKPIGDAVAELFDVAQSTIASGKMDAAGSVVLGDKKLTVLFAGAIKEPEKVQSAFQKLVSAAEKDANFNENVSIKSDKHAGADLQIMSFKVKDDEAKEVFGDTLDVILGTGNNSVYLAAGNEALDRLKQAIDASAGSAGKKAIAPAEFRVSLAPVFRFASTVDKNNKLAPMMAEELAKSGGKDHVTVILRPIKNGVGYRFEAEEGVLQLLGTESRAAAAGAAK